MFYFEVVNEATSPAEESSNRTRCLVHHQKFVLVLKEKWSLSYCQATNNQILVCNNVHEFVRHDDDLASRQAFECCNDLLISQSQFFQIVLRRSGWDHDL